MTNIILLIGEMAAGKSTIEKALGKTKHRAISYTTRSPRKNEKKGRDYHFISNQEFNRLWENGTLYEKTSYGTGDDITQYGLGKKSFSDKKDNVAVVNVDGLISLSKNKDISERIFAFHIKTPLEERLMRHSYREGEFHFTDQLKKRLERDKIDFGERLENLKKTQYVFEIENTNKMIDDIVQEIENIINKT
jgi:guanylate kinase